MRMRLSSLAVLLSLGLVAPLRAQILEQVLVKVNGDILTKTEFEGRQIVELRNRPELANVTPASPELRRAISEVTPELILSAVDELLLVQRGRELGWAMGDAQFKQILENIKKQNNLEDEERFQAALRQENLSMADLRRNLERSMLVSQVQRAEVMDKISITDDEAKVYYEANTREFTTPAEVTLREILIEVPTTDRGVNVAQDDEVRAKAEDARKRLLSGESFARLAAEFSVAPSKANGGLIGPIKHDELAPELQKMLGALKVGDVTEILRAPRGYQLLKLESRSESKVLTFEEARADIAAKVAEQKRRGEMQKYLDRLREQATITWRNPELKKAYDQALTKRRQESGRNPEA